MSDPVSVGILGLGSYLPPQVRDNSFWDGRLPVRTVEQRSKDWLAIERTTSGEETELRPEVRAAMAELGDDPYRGARLRRVLDDASEVSDMEAEAARRAIADAGLLPEDIDLCIVHSLVPDAASPYNPPALQHKCGLHNAVAWSQDLGCASFQSHLITAASLVRAGAFRHVLLVYSTCASRILDYDKPDSLGMGDGASACVVGAVPAGYGLLGHYLRTDGAFRDGVIIAPVVDGQAQRRWWEPCRGPLRLSTFNVGMGKLLGVRSSTFCREASEAALRAAGRTLSDVDLFICNQSTGWFISACRGGLGLPREKAIDTFAELANVGSVASTFNLERARQEGKLRDGDLVLSYSPSAGFTRAATVFRWFQRPATSA